MVCDCSNPLSPNSSQYCLYSFFLYLNNDKVNVNPLTSYCTKHAIDRYSIIQKRKCLYFEECRFQEKYLYLVKSRVAASESKTNKPSLTIFSFEFGHHVFSL